MNTTPFSVRCPQRSVALRLAPALLAVWFGADLWAGEAPDRVPNGGFEASPTQPVGWRVFNLAGDGFRASIVAGGHSGERALRIERTAAGGDAGVDLWESPVAVVPGEELILRFAARNAAGDERSRLHVSAHEFAVAGTFLTEVRHDTVFTVPTDGFAEFAWPLRVTSPLAALVSVGFRLGDADGGLSHPGAYLVDDVTLGPGVPAPAAAVAGAPAVGLLPADGVSVRTYGAKGDGTTDDTVAFQRAMNDRHQAGGGLVHVPAGHYRIATHLLVPPGVTLGGVWEAPPIPVQFRPPAQTPRLAGSILLAVEGAGDPDGTPFIRLDASACLRGLTIVYPDQTQTNPPVAYPWTVATVGADNCSIIDVLILNPYQAVDFGSRPSGRHYIRGLYADPLYRGLYIDQCLDVGRVENVHFWPFYDCKLGGPLRTFVLENAEAFVIGRTDWEYMTNCFAFGYRTGFHFVRGRGDGPYAGPGNVLMTQSGADMSDAAILVDGLQGHSGVLASNSQFFGDLVVGERNVGPLRFSNCGFYGSLHGRRGASQALLDGEGSVSFQNCHFIDLHPENRAPVSILARHGTLSLVGCEFMTAGKQQVVLEAGVRRAVVTSNQFAGRARLANRAGGQTEVRGNVDDTPAMPEGAVMVDDDDQGTGFSCTGPWHTAREPGHFLGACRWIEPGVVGAAVEWCPALPRSGRYAVEVWCGPDPNRDHAADASFTVHHATGTETCRVDQRAGTSQWHRLGVFPFEAGTTGRVTLSGAAAGNPVADAVRFLPVAE